MNLRFWQKKSPQKLSSSITVPTVAEMDRMAIKVQQYEIELQQAQALSALAEGVASIAGFLRNGGLREALAAHTKGQIISDILGGLASHDGRKSLDARTIKQNSLEIVETVEAVFNKMHERLQDRNRDPEIHPVNEEEPFQ